MGNIKNKFSKQITKIRALFCIVVFISLGVVACSDSPFNARGGEGEKPGIEASSFGLVEVTISGIGSDNMTANAKSVDPNVATNLSQPSGTALGTGDGTIQLESISNGSYTIGSRTSGYRYIWATFNVRNAQADGTPYTTDRTNLTFLAADTDASFGADETYGETAISMFRLFEGTELTGSSAETIANNTLPTGRVARTATGPYGEIKLLTADVLQVFTEAEIAALTPPSGISLFPYGFMTRKWDGNRTLSANPSSGNFEGYVTFAFIVPLQTQANQDPFEISAMFLPVDDDETRMTQSPIEQSTAGINDVIAARANAINAAYVNVFPGTTYQGMRRLLCEPVRITGTAGSPLTTIPIVPGRTIQSVDPAPYSGNRSHIAEVQNFLVTLSDYVYGRDEQAIIVRGSQSGNQFLNFGGTVSANTVGTLAPANFYPGEMVEVSITAGLGVCPGKVYRYRVAASGDNNVTFSASTGSPYSVGDRPWNLAVGDLNNDGKPDIVAGNYIDQTVTVLLGDGNGGYTEASGSPYTVAGQISDIALGDLDEDGNLDMAVIDGDVTILMGDGSGGFTEAPGSPVSTGNSPNSIALGDLDADGDLDMAVANYLDNDVSVFVSDGRGSFEEKTLAGSPFSVGNHPISVALGDLNGDGDLDIVVANSGSDNISILDNSGNAWFGVSNITPVTTGTGPAEVVLGDLNGDGNLDMAVANSSDDQVEIFQGNGAYGFSSKGTETITDMQSLSLGDLDGDNNLDLVSVGQSVEVILNNGAWSFSVTSLSQITMQVRSSSLSDVDVDGDLDIVVTNNWNDKVSVWLNN